MSALSATLEDHMEEYYKILGVPIDTELRQVKEAYRDITTAPHQPDYAAQFHLSQNSTSASMAREKESKSADLTT